MKLYILSLLSILLIALGSCVTPKWKYALVSTGNIDDAIENSITDFLHSSKLIKTDTVFNVLIENNDSEVLIISIIRPSDLIRPGFKNKVGTYDNIFPTKYRIKENKLFYWNDSTQAISQHIIDALIQYEHIDFSWSELPYEVINGVHDDGVEGLVYYICKNNFRNYKKTKTSNITRYYPAPTLNCDKQ